MNRYARQLSLPEITPAHQEKLLHAKIIMVGAGGLGAAALPCLAGAGVGHITVIDHDTVDITNIHRQTIYKESDVGRNKAECAAEYLRALNSEIEIHAITRKFLPDDGLKFDLILDGSDNFETKIILNQISIQTRTPLITASVEGFNGMVGIFTGFDDNAPCYRCLYPELPLDACKCADGGILGTAAGLAGMYQAHLALCFLLEISDARAGTFLSLDFKNLRMSRIKISKNEDCVCCNFPLTPTLSPLGRGSPAGTGEGAKTREKTKTIALISKENLQNALIIDVRTYDEVETAPIKNAIHIPLDEIPARYQELPKDKRLAFACVSNIRSRKAAEFMATMGYDNVCILDRRVNALS
jgi:molybdopterin/thiamine biosynthesis adenylyltransferase/rhodanese-related sulfurtransferase